MHEIDFYNEVEILEFNTARFRTFLINAIEYNMKLVPSEKKETTLEVLYSVLDEFYRIEQESDLYQIRKTTIAKAREEMGLVSEEEAIEVIPEERH